MDLTARLAIIFVISNFIAFGKIEVNLPSSSTKENLKDVKHTITITKSNEFYIDSVAVEKEKLQEKVSTFSKDDFITVISDEKAFYEDFIFVVDILKSSGLEKISMAVEQ